MKESNISCHRAGGINESVSAYQYGVAASSREIGVAGHRRLGVIKYRRWLWLILRRLCPLCEASMASRLHLSKSISQLSWRRSPEKAIGHQPSLACPASAARRRGWPRRGG